MFFIGLLGVSLLSTVCIWICDFATTGYINMNIAQREAFDASRSVGERDDRSYTNLFLY